MGGSNGQSALMLVTARLRHVAGTAGAWVCIRIWKDCQTSSKRNGRQTSHGRCDRTWFAL